MENRSIRLDVPDRDWVRSVPVKAMFRPPEADDLDTIAEGWGVPVATAVWAIVVEQLARWRRQAPDLGPHGLAIAAATTVLQMRPGNPYTAGREQPERYPNIDQDEVRLICWLAIEAEEQV
jgi:hypothetical protein